MPMRGELPPVTARSYAHTRAPTSAAERTVSRIVAILSDRDLHAVLAFCAIGILLTFNIVLRFPDFGTQVASLAIFP
jgi:hypothetical protein